MALRAGYKGIKNSLARGLGAFMQKFSDALVIKSIGSGLNLSEAGELTASAQSVNYSTTPVKTGQKWIDGITDIYAVTVHDDEVVTPASKEVDIDFSSFNIDKIISIEILVRVTNDPNTDGAWQLLAKPWPESGWSVFLSDYTASGITIKLGNNWTNVKEYICNIKFIAAVSQNTRKKGGNK